MKQSVAALGPGQNALFDFARGLAALAVLASHLRAFVFVNWDQAESPGALWAGFYFLTSLGHQAVIVFFVLSGYFISASVAREAAAGSFTYTAYFTKRLSRLWIVLAPALLLTMLWDQLGMRLSSGAFYSGAYADTFFSGPTPANAVEAYSPATLLANFLFLQTISAPPFGSNGPLWSLANEFWYYVIFPLIFVALRMKSSLSLRIAQLALAAIILVWLPREIALYGLIWLMGFGVYMASRRIRLTPVTRILVTGAGFAGFLVLLAAPRVLDTTGWVIDFPLAAAFALWMFGAAGSTRPRAPSRIADLLARPSYTVYLTHFPFIAFIVSITLEGERFAPGIAGACAFAAIFASALIYAWAVYWLFERKTETVQKFLKRALRQGQAQSL